MRSVRRSELEAGTAFACSGGALQFDHIDRRAHPTSTAPAVQRLPAARHALCAHPPGRDPARDG